MFGKWLLPPPLVVLLRDTSLGYLLNQWPQGVAQVVLGTGECKGEGAWMLPLDTLRVALGSCRRAGPGLLGCR